MIDRLLNGLYMPHGYCLLWDPWLVAVHAGSDLATFGAYSAIPLAMWMFVRKRPHLELKRLAQFFAAFILWCGLTHLFGLITLWWPVYELQGIVKAITAAISVATAVMIFPLIPKALAIPSPSELQRANDELQKEVLSHRRTLAELTEARALLEKRVLERTEDLQLAKDQLHALFEHAPVAMVRVSAAGCVAQVNRAAELLFRAGRRDLEGLSVETLVPASHRAAHVDLRHGFESRPTQRPLGAGRELSAQRPDGSGVPVEIGLNPLPGPEGGVVASLVSIEERKMQERRTQLIMRELSHRSKNLLAVIQGMVRQVARTSADLAEFEKAFARRLQGLARSHDLLVGTEWQGTTVDGLVRTHLSAVSAPEALDVAGPPQLLSPDAAQTLGLALHELATNALKYGALAKGGSLSVTWVRTDDQFELCWRETGFAAAKERRGFGSSVLERIVPHSLGGTSAYVLDATGLAWTLSIPLRSLMKSERQVQADALMPA